MDRFALLVCALCALAFGAALVAHADGPYTLQNVDISSGGNTMKSPSYGATSITAEAVGGIGTSPNYGMEVILPLTHGSTLTAVPPETPQIREFSLGANFPNPFNPNTTIVFELPRQTAVTLQIFDVSGRLVKALLQAEAYEAGRHQVVWSGRDRGGRPASSGTYFYRLEAGEFTKTRRMTLVK